MVKREISFAIAFLIFSMLACNLPGVSLGEAEITATPLVPIITVTVAVANTAAITPTETIIPLTPTSSVSPEVTLTKNSNCRVGPSTFYNISDQIAEKKVLPVIGRNDDSTWWQVDNGSGRVCWIFNENAEENTDFSGLPIVDAPPLPGTPGQFIVANQLCQPGPQKFEVTLSWSSGGGETGFRLFRDGQQIIEVKANKFNYKDANAPYNKNISYEIEAFNANGTSDRAIQIVPACK